MAVCIKSLIQNMNVVIGCSYCYARNNVRRFHTVEDFEDLIPSMSEEQMVQELPTAFNKS